MQHTLEGSLDFRDSFPFGRDNPTPNRETIRHVEEQNHPREVVETPVDVVLEQRIESRAELGPDESPFDPDSESVAADPIVRIVPRALESDGPFSIVGHDASPSNDVSPFRVDGLGPYVTVTGNHYRRFFFIALRFKNPILILKRFASNQLQIPSDTCLVVDTAADTLHLKLAEPTLLFTSRYPYEWGKNPSERDLLESLFPPIVSSSKRFT
ncbi:hypothetical protein AVEN_123898-1 [Araneus ventricosus]|uniref:Uncharacterized protein n=1 Tax=Araneus ventricosus TaxID=182803 RepID=A0A4Y2BBY9_ARAVE|nr:hypothetical protein AVEN_123898-1 [Araneus ventricosus]